MKFNKKIVVTALSTALGLGIVGSITGTIAWYQYSTRSTAAFIGTSVKSSANLEVSIDGINYQNILTSSQVSTYLAGTDYKNGNVAPITTGADTAKNGALPAKLYSNPAYQDFAYDGDDSNNIRGWSEAKKIDYVQFKLTLRYLGVENGQSESGIKDKKIYLNDLLIDENGSNSKKNISDAVRVHLDSTNDMYLSNNGQTTVMGGKLDLNGDGKLDTNGKWEDLVGNGTETAYGNEAASQQTYKLSDVAPTMSNGSYQGDNYLGLTDANGKLEVTVTIWLEGWQKLYNSVSTNAGDDVEGLYVFNSVSGEYEVQGAGEVADGTTQYYELSDIWNENDYVGAVFHVGLEFVVDRIN